MSADGWIYNDELPAYYGFFHALNPQQNPVVTMLSAKGVTIVPNKVYGLTYHEIANETSANLKPDLAVPTKGSTNFTTGSNTCQVWFEGCGVSYARKGDQAMGRVVGYQNPSNPSIEPDPMARGLIEAVGKIKSQLEWIGREGEYAIPSTGTTGTWEQRGYRYAEGLTIGTCTGAVAGTGTLGTLGTLNFTLLQDTLQSIYDAGNWGNGVALTALCNSTVKRALTDIFKSEYNMGKNGVSTNKSGVNLTTFETDFGDVDILLTRNFPKNDLYFLNMGVMDIKVRPVPGMPDGGWLFEDEMAHTAAGKEVGIYTEMGIDYASGSFHGRIFGIGSTVSAGLAVS